MDALRETLISFAVLFAVFLPLERLYAARPQPVFRPGWGTDLLFFLGQYLLWTAPVVAALTWIYRHADLLPLQGAQQAVAALPLALQFVLVILLSDLCIYWGHRLSHRYEVLWRFHRVHHTAERMDWLCAHREHPFDNLYTRTIENLPLILLGLPMHLIAGFAVFRGLWAIYIHSNVTLSPGPLRYLIGSSRLHHWHHAIATGGRVNYANLSPLMDLLFGTFHDPGRMPDRVGLTEPAARGYFGQLLEPLLPARLRARLQAAPEAGGISDGRSTTP